MFLALENILSVYLNLSHVKGIWEYFLSFDVFALWHKNDRISESFIVSNEIYKKCEQ